MTARRRERKASLTVSCLRSRKITPRQLAETRCVTLIASIELFGCMASFGSCLLRVESGWGVEFCSRESRPRFCLDAMPHFGVRLAYRRIPILCVRSLSRQHCSSLLCKIAQCVLARQCECECDRSMRRGISLDSASRHCLV
jgi:hypothetical protein